MRWKHPEQYDTRVIKTFAIFPIRLGDETRWLEWVYINQVYKFEPCLFVDLFDQTAWVNESFNDKIKRRIKK